MEQGLTKSQVENRIKNGQINGEFEGSTKTVKRIVVDNVVTLFNIVNFIMAIGIAMVHSYRNMMFISVVVWNIAIGIFQELKAKRIIDKMTLITQPKACAIRDGHEQYINFKDIVIDDIIKIKRGNQVCADAVIVSGDCCVSESLISGESDMIYKSCGDTIYAGSFITSGYIYARVVAVGSENYIGSLTNKSKYYKISESQMLRAIKFIIKFVSICIVPLVIIIFNNQVNITGNTFENAVVNTVAAVIGTMPSGLILLTTVVMEVSVIKLSGFNTLVQDMYSIESLARVDTICLDKTGTITLGKMEVSDIIGIDCDNPEELVQIFCNTMKDENETLNALIEKYFTDEKYTATKVIPFSSEKKWSLVSVEEVGTIIIGAAKFMDIKDIDFYMETIKKYSKEGYRVLILGFSDSVMNNDTIPSDLECKAIILLKDMIKPSAKSAIEYFKKQGVDIKIISGDNPYTITRAAMDSGVEGYDNVIDCTGISDEELKEKCENHVIFGRISPQQKLAVIEGLRENGHVVGMIGDGVNDIMAIREADCGIAMQNGSDAVKCCSQMILLDSEFSQIPKIIEEGRKTINNIERSATLYLVKTIYSFVLALVFIFVNMRYPFVPIQLTLIGALSIGIPSFMLAMEPNIDKVTGSFLRNVLKKAIPGAIGILINIAISIFIANSYKMNNEELSTITTYLVSIAAMVVLFDLCRPFTEFRLLMCAILSILFVAILSFCKSILFITAISGKLLVVILLIGIMTIIIHSINVKITEKVFCDE